MPTSNLRTAPYGHPPSQMYNNYGTDFNERLNPGRFKFGPTSSMGYYDNFADPWSLLWIDELARQTPEEDGAAFTIPPTSYPAGYQYRENGYQGSPVEGGDVYPATRESAPDEPDYSDGSFILNRKNNWQSGPPKNGFEDNAVPKAGYWTQAGGPNSEDSKNHFGHQMLTSSKRPIMLYNMGHGNVASQGGCAATNVIGWDGYIQADKQGSSDILVGVEHAYSMYTCDLKLTDFNEYVDKIEAWLCDQGETEYCKANRVVPPDSRATRGLTAWLDSFGPQPRTPTIKLVIRILKMIKKVIEQAQSDGVVGGMLVNWDFICEMNTPTRANQFRYSREDRDEVWKWEEADKPLRFSYVIDEISQIFVQILNLRINGALWHLSSPEKSGLPKNRILRYRNFAHIHSIGIMKGIDHKDNGKYLQLLPHWHKDIKPNSILDTSYRFSQG